MPPSFRIRLLSTGLLAACIAAGAASAQDAYPSKPVTIIVPSAPGGANDIAARLFSKELSASWKVPVIVENRAGSSGVLASSLVARAPKDGYTTLLTFTAHVQLPSLNPKLPYDSMKDFAPVSQTALSYSILSVPSDFPVNNIKEFVDKVKASPEQMSYGSTGAGTTSHIYGDLFNKQAGTNMVHVPYRSAVSLISDMIGGHIKVGVTDVGATIPYIRQGKIRPLAIIGTRRAAMLPQVPTFLESGYKGFEQVAWMGFVVPSGVPKDRLDKLSAELARITKLPSVSNHLANVNLEPVGGTADEFAAVMDKDFAVWKGIIERSGIKITE